MRNILFLLSFFWLLFAPFQAHAFTPNSERIERFDVNINVQKSGYVDINENITYNFGNNKKRGIIRTISTIDTNSAGKRYLVEIENISLNDNMGKPIPYELTRSRDHITLKIGDPNKYISGTQQYMLSYQMRGLITYFDTHDEIYMNAIETRWTTPIQNARVTVNLPPEVRATNIDSICYTGKQGNTSTNCTKNVSNNTVTFASLGQLNAGEGLTIAVSFPKNIVAQVERQPEEPREISALEIAIILGIIALALFWYIIYPIIIAILWWLKGRDPDVGKPVSAYFDPPKTSKGDSLTPAETGTLIDEIASFREIAATIVHLAQRGHLVIEEKDKNSFEFVKKDNPNDTMKNYEKRLYDVLFKKGDRVKIKDLKLHGKEQEVYDMLYHFVMDEEFFPHNPRRIRSFYNAIIGVAGITLNIPLLISSIFFGRNMPRKTIYGAQEANKAKSLKNFLSSQERQLEFQADKQMMFEKLLPYAVAFGVEKLWMKRFENITLQKPDWYVSNSPVFNSLLLSNALTRSFNDLSTSFNPDYTKKSSTGFSSGFSGGSSGGGFGSGGGGSW